MQRKISELGMKADYEADDDLRLMIVQWNDVVDTFEILAESMCHSERLNELFSYFEHTFVRGRRIRGSGENFAPAVFPPENWNKYEDTNSGVARTNNAVEGWHHALQSLLSRQHPTMWTFLNGLRKDCRQYTASVLQTSAGVHTKQ